MFKEKKKKSRLNPGIISVTRCLYFCYDNFLKVFDPNIVDLVQHQQIVLKIIYEGRPSLSKYPTLSELFFVNHVYLIAFGR